jgi:hypothetical protein
MVRAVSDDVLNGFVGLENIVQYEQIVSLQFSDKIGKFVESEGDKLERFFFFFATPGVLNRLVSLIAVYKNNPFNLIGMLKKSTAMTNNLMQKSCFSRIARASNEVDTALWKNGIRF